MSFDRSLWAGMYTRDGFPRFRCPRCQLGRLLFDKNNLVVSQPQYSKANEKHPEWEPEWDTHRFSAKLICDDKDCGEIVIVSGETIVEEDFDEDSNGIRLLCLIRPRYFFPAPPLINIPKEVPKEVTNEIDRASHLFWADFSSSANRLRVSVELLLDFFKIPRMGIDKHGKPNQLDLNARIALFEKTDADHAQTLTALRMIGNLGSHGSDVAREALLDAFEIYEYALAELCGQRKMRIATIRKKLIDSKGKY